MEIQVIFRLQAIVTDRMAFGTRIQSKLSNVLPQILACMNRNTVFGVELLTASATAVGEFPSVKPTFLMIPRQGANKYQKAQLKDQRKAKTEPNSVCVPNECAV